MIFVFIVALFLIVMPIILASFSAITSIDLSVFINMLDFLYEAMASGIGIITYFIPSSIVIGSFSIFLILEGVYYGYRLLMFVLTKIPMLGISE